MSISLFFFLFFFFNDTATTEIYTLSLHDALPIFLCSAVGGDSGYGGTEWHSFGAIRTGDRKSTRLNSSHTVISYAVFCLKKKKTTHNICFAPAVSRGPLHIWRLRDAWRGDRNVYA